MIIVLYFFSKQGVEGISKFGTSGDKTVIKVSETEKSAKSVQVARGWLWEVQDSLYFGKERMNARTVDRMS